MAAIVDHRGQPATLGAYLHVLRRQWRFGALIGLSVAALAISFILGLPKLYRANTTVLVQRVGETTPGEIDARLQAIKQEALSRGRLTELVERLDLYPIPRQEGEDVIPRLQRDIKLENTNPEQINGQPATIAFKLSYVGVDPESAAAVPNAVASFYVEQSDEMRLIKAAQNAELLRAQLSDLKKRLDEQEGRIRGYAARNIGALPEQVSANLATLERLNAQLRMNLDTQMKLVERRQTLRNQLAETDAKPPTDPNSPAAQLAQLKKELSEQARFTDKYPEVKALKEEIAALERQVAAGPKAATGGLSSASVLQASLTETESQSARLEHENELIRRSIAAYERRVESTPARAPDFQALSGDYQAIRDQYDALQKRYQDALLGERAERGKNRAEFRILDRAQVPKGPAGPPRWYLLGIAVLVAIGVGVAAAVLADWVDPSFHNIDDLRMFTDVPVLASIPQIGTTRDKWAQRWRAGVLVTSTGAAAASLGTAAFLAAREGESVARMLLKLG
jgi:polysaccharide chain length determinant protein (PEP-CTERM system associated)